MVTIYWAGDSTAAQNSIATWPQTGIAQEFERFVKPHEVRVENHAVNGRSTKSKNNPISQIGPAGVVNGLPCAFNTTV